MTESNKAIVLTQCDVHINFVLAPELCNRPLWSHCQVGIFIEPNETGYQLQNLGQEFHSGMRIRDKSGNCKRTDEAAMTRGPN